jgi:hypothetical protein
MGHREVFFGLCREAAKLQNSSCGLNSVGEQTVFLAVPVWFANAVTIGRDFYLLNGLRMWRTSRPPPPNDCPLLPNAGG